MPNEITPSGPTGIKIRNGGTLLYDDGTTIPDSTGSTDTGALLGPLEFAVPSGGTVEIDSLQFGPGDDDDGWFIFSTAVAGAGVATVSTEETDTDLYRRGALALLASIAVGALVADRATADDDEIITLSVATIDIEEVDSPFTLRVMDIVDEALPPTTDILIDQEGTRVGSIAEENERIDLQDEPGEITVYLRDSKSRLARLLAWVRSHIPSDTSITFKRKFPDGKMASDFSDDEFVRLTSHPAIVEPVRESSKSGTVFKINNTEIPHVDEGESEAGAWDIVGDSLIYEVGSNPPAKDQWELETKLSFIQRIRT